MLVLASSIYRAVSGGTRCEWRTTSGPERASLLTPGGNSIRRPADPASQPCPRLSRSYAFSCRHYIRYIRGIGRGPISHGRLELRPYSTGICRIYIGEREREETGPRGLADRQYFPPPSLSPEKPKRRYHGAVGDSRARERAVTERRCNKLTGSNWLSYNVTSQFAEFSREARGRIYVKQQRPSCYFNSKPTVRRACTIYITLPEPLNLTVEREDYGILF